MKKFAVILAILVALALLGLILFLVLGPRGQLPPGPGPANATVSGNATGGNATAPGNATAANATASGKAPVPGNATAPGNATGGNATSSPASEKQPYELVAGAFLSQAAANRTAADLRARGLAAALFVRPDAGGENWHEVHLGRYPDLAAAEAAAAGLAAAKGVWAPPRPADPSAKPLAAGKGPATVWLVSAGEYLTRHAAETRAKELAAKGFEPCVVRTADALERAWYAVAVGQAKTEQEAAALAGVLAEKTGLPGRVSAEDAASLAGRRLCE